MVPYLLLKSRRIFVGIAAAALLLLALGLIGFGTGVFDSLGLLSSNQGRSSRLSLPYKVAELFGNRDLVRLLFGLAFAGVAGWTLWRTWRGADPIRMAGWATLAILLASLDPLTAWADSRRRAPA